MSSNLSTRAPSTRLATSAIVGIVLGCFFGVALILLCALPFCLRARRQRRARDQEAAVPGSEGLETVEISPTGPTRRLSKDVWPPGGTSDGYDEYDTYGTYQHTSPTHQPTVDHVPQNFLPTGSDRQDSGLPALHTEWDGSDPAMGPPGLYASPTDSNFDIKRFDSFGYSRRDTGMTDTSLHTPLDSLQHANTAESVPVSGSTSHHASPDPNQMLASTEFQRGHNRHVGSVGSSDTSPTFSPPVGGESPVSVGENASYYDQNYPGLPRGSYPPPGVKPSTAKSFPLPQFGHDSISHVIAPPLIPGPASAPAVPQYSQQVATSPVPKLEEGDKSQLSSIGAFKPEAGDDERTRQFRSPSPPGIPLDFSSPSSAHSNTPTAHANPMDIFMPTTDSEMRRWVDQELGRMSASPPLELEHATSLEHEAVQPVSPGPTFPGFKQEGAGLPGDSAASTYPTQLTDETGHAFASFIHQPATPLMDVDMVSDVSSPHAFQGSSGPSYENTPDTRLDDTDMNDAYPSEQSDSDPKEYIAPATPNHLAVPDSSPEQESPASTAEGVFICEHCDRRFDQIHKLNHHKRYHTKPHRCPYQGCNKDFGTKTHLNRHINDRHEKNVKFFCDQPSCAWSRNGNKWFPRKDNWRRHMINKHKMNGNIVPGPELIEYVNGNGGL